MASSDGAASNMMSTRPPADVDHRRTAAAIGHVQHVDAGHDLEQFA